MQHSSWKLLFLLIFRPSKFIELSEEYVRWANTPEGKSTNSARDAGSHSAKQAREIRSGLIKSLAWVLAAVSTGWCAGILLEATGVECSKSLSEYSQYLGIGVLLWATLGRGGWPIQTLEGNTPPEQVDLFVYQLLYVLGSFFLAVSASLAYGT